jgi:hypothetical protein
MNRHLIQKVSTNFKELTDRNVIYFARFQNVTNLTDLITPTVQESAAIVNAELVQFSNSL